jgi:2-dehydro-3-deoxyphosphogluconate aldolase/(4S)-4-hydroxy-2-oxoglutarate aldolase
MREERAMPSQTMRDLLAGVTILPVLTISRVDAAVPLARLLVEEGFPVLEITLRTPAALPAVQAIVAKVPEAVVGVGTVLKATHIEPCLQAGAKFLVSPGTTPELANAFAQAPVPTMPGCATVSEAMWLADRRFEVLKFFPAQPAGGVAWLRSVAEPMPHVAFCPTGGIDLRNAADYLALPNVVCVGGSWMVPQDAAGDLTRIRSLAREAAQLGRKGAAAA